MKKMRKMLGITQLRRNKPKLLPEPRGPSVEHHDYSPETGHLIVTFRGGRQYRYEGVAQETADGLAKAESKGSFINSHIAGRHKIVSLP